MMLRHQCHGHFFCFQQSPSLRLQDTPGWPLGFDRLRCKLGAFAVSPSPGVSSRAVELACMSCPSRLGSASRFADFSGFAAVVECSTSILQRARTVINGIPNFSFVRVFVIRNRFRSLQILSFRRSDSGVHQRWLLCASHTHTHTHTLTVARNSRNRRLE